VRLFSFQPNAQSRPEIKRFWLTFSISVPSRSSTPAPSPAKSQSPAKVRRKAKRKRELARNSPFCATPFCDAPFCDAPFRNAPSSEVMGEPFGIDPHHGGYKVVVAGVVGTPNVAIVPQFAEGCLSPFDRQPPG